MSSDVMDELRTLTVEELSQATGIQAWRIRELVKKGKGPAHFRVGTTYRFPNQRGGGWTGGRMSDRPEPGTPEEEIYSKLLPAVSRRTRCGYCVRTAGRLIQKVGRLDKEVRPSRR